MPRSSTKFLKPEILAHLGKMELRAATIVEGLLSGLHRSPFRGVSVEFAEYRAYQPGDEPKHIDWKAYARTDKLYIKECEDQTNLEATIIMDASASMGFGGNGLTKWQYGGFLAACLAYILQRQKDAVALVILDEQIRVDIPPRSTRSHLAQMIAEMEKADPSRRTALGKALHQVARRLKRKGMVILVSDLLDEPGDVLSGLQHLQFGGNDVIVFQTMDARELNFDFEGPHMFLDPETNAFLPAIAQEVREQYRKALNDFLVFYSEEMGKRNIFHTMVDTSRPVEETLLWFLTQNARISSRF
jgi:uncharacterized protein (DUF58 family)